jgi:hypothetical protein
VTGSTADALVEVVKERSITDVVMASHGRTGLAHVMLGSVADGLIHQLRRPIVVVRALVTPVAERGSPYGDQASGGSAPSSASDHLKRS